MMAVSFKYSGVHIAAPRAQSIFLIFVFGRTWSSLRCPGVSLWCLPHCRAQALERGRQYLRFTLASLLQDMWNLPATVIESTSPALAGRFLSSGPPGKSPQSILN